MRQVPVGADRVLSRADAVFYAACASLIMLVVLINTLPHAEKWVGPHILNRLPPIAALYQSGHRILHYLVVSFIVNAPFQILAGAVGALVFLFVQHPRSLAYSLAIMMPQVLFFLFTAGTGPQPTWLWLIAGAAWTAIAIAVFHGLSLAASHVAVVPLGRERQPTARTLRLTGVTLAIIPACYLALEAHSYLWKGFNPNMRGLVPLGMLALLLCLTIRYGSRPALTATITAAGLLMFLFSGQLLSLISR